VQLQKGVRMIIKRLVVGAAGAATAGAIWMGVAGEDHTTRDSSGAITVEGQLGAFVTKVGDCLNDLPDAPASGIIGVSTVTGVSCQAAHHWQVFHKEDLTLTQFDNTEVGQASYALCESAAKSLVLSMSDAIYNEYRNAGLMNLQPQQMSWDEGDRAVDCLIGSETQTYYDSVFE